MNHQAAAQALYTRRGRMYDAMVSVIGHRGSYERFFRRHRVLAPGMRILDAGCGSGALTLGLMALARQERTTDIRFSGFDLTPSMLEAFRTRLDQVGGAAALEQADVLAVPDTLPASWRGQDLVVSSGMLEYVPRERPADALRNLRALLAPDGKIFVFISRDHAFNRLFIGRFWRANLYTAAQLEEAFAVAGFRDLELERFRTWGWAASARA